VKDFVDDVTEDPTKDALALNSGSSKWWLGIWIKLFYGCSSVKDYNNMYSCEHSCCSLRYVPGASVVNTSHE